MFLAMTTGQVIALVFAVIIVIAILCSSIKVVKQTEKFVK